LSESSTPALQATNLSHAYSSYQVLAPTDLTLHAGELVTLHGANGAGKSTLLLCLAGLLRPTTGEVLACGHDLYEDEPAAKRALAFVPDVPRFYLELTTWEHLRFIALAHGVPEGFEARAEQWLHDYGLWEVRDMFPHHFSRGMRLKLGLLLAFIRPFQVLLLDEPTSALDDASTQLVGHHLEELRAQGAAILVATHDPVLSQRLADRSLTLADGLLAPKA
jgi:ABC-2 type transport system ATP-binding protein